MSRRRRGFTLTEAAIGGSVLLVGLVFVTQMTRVALDATGSADNRVAAIAPMIEQYMRATVAAYKAQRGNTAILAVPPLRLPNGGDVWAALDSANDEPTKVGGAQTYRVYTVTFRMTDTSRAQVLGNPIVGRVIFGKCDTSAATKVGL